MKKFKENTVNTIGFILHAVQFHKPTGAFIMKHVDGYFWVLMFLFATSIVSNLFIS